MSKHRKAPVDASHPAPSPDQNQTQSQGTGAYNSITRRVMWQLAAVLGTSIVLGFAFNASSPVGVRIIDENSESLAAAAPPAPQPPSFPVAAFTNRMVVLPPSPTPIQITPEKPAPLSELKHTPFPVIAQASTPSVTSAAPAPHTHAPAALVPLPATPLAELNPGPIHWAQAKPLVAAGQAVLVDVRHKAMYDAGHIPSAISLPETSSPEEFTAFLNQHPTNLTLIVYCSSVSCSQSARVANRLVTQFQRPSVKYMTGGYMEYQQAELSKNPAQPTP